MTITQETARSYLDAGLAVLPASKAEKRPVLPGWSEYQNYLPTADQVGHWFASERDAVCIVCGRGSGNLEIIDFDQHDELYPKWKAAIPAELLARLVVEQTQSGGYHVAYRSEEEVSKNMKLAQGIRDGKMATLIETRGTGGIILCAPGDGYTLIQGDYTHLPVLTNEERETLLRTAWNLNEAAMPVKPESVPTMEEDSRFEIRPGDDFNECGDVRSVLLKHGWASLGIKPDDNEYWRRPGKENGEQSATLKDGVFFVFSSNAAPFEPGKAYSKFHVYALLEHGGDFSSAANTLLHEGYGREQQEILPNIDEIIANFLKNKRDKDVFTAGELMRRFETLKEPIIDGLLRRSEVMNVVAAPKTGKSWLIMQLAYSLIFGYDWMGFPCRKSKVVIMDNELHPETISSRLLRVAHGMNIPCSAPELDNLIINTQRLHRRTMDEIISTKNDLKEQKIDVVIIDALYRIFPKDVDENNNGQITQMYNKIDQFAQETGAAVILVHHTSKGNQGNKNVTDIGSGAGAQSRAPDTHLVLRPHKEDGVTVLDCRVRSFPQPKAFCIKKDEYNLWARADEHSPEELAGRITGSSSAGAKKQKTISEAEKEFFSKLEMLQLPMAKTQFVVFLKEQLGISREKTTALLDKLIAADVLVEHKGEGGLKRPAAKMIYFSPSYKRRYQEIMSPDK